MRSTKLQMLIGAGARLCDTVRPVPLIEWATERNNARRSRRSSTGTFPSGAGATAQYRRIMSTRAGSAVRFHWRVLKRAAAARCSRGRGSNRLNYRRPVASQYRSRSRVPISGYCGMGGNEPALLQTVHTGSGRHWERL